MSSIAEQVTLVITDRFDLGRINLSGLKKREDKLDIQIQSITAEDARWRIMESKSYSSEFYLTSDMCKKTCNSLLECDITLNKGRIPLFDINTVYLIIAFDNDLNPLYYLIS